MKVIHIKTDLDFYNVIPAYAAAHGRYYGKHVIVLYGNAVCAEVERRFANVVR